MNVLALNAGSSLKCGAARGRAGRGARRARRAGPARRGRTRPATGARRALRCSRELPAASRRSATASSTAASTSTARRRSTTRSGGAARGYAELAPLHNAAGLAGSRPREARFADVPQVAVFDTAFHAGCRAAARTYAARRVGHALRRYGFHGINHEYARTAPRKLGRPLGRAALVTLPPRHGCSGGGPGRPQRRHDDGLHAARGPRHGDALGPRRPRAVRCTSCAGGPSRRRARTRSHHDSGLRGLSGVSGDLRDVLAAATAATSGRGSRSTSTPTACATLGAMLRRARRRRRGRLHGGHRRELGRGAGGGARAVPSSGLGLDGERNAARRSTATSPGRRRRSAWSSRGRTRSGRSPAPRRAFGSPAMRATVGLLPHQK